ncbi:Hsp33 family molecular chaperone [Tyzzerella sp. An114]|uniref:Hsp33 family molecular chaperone HslO n=1 Tax=Tyzzerella sp. An114 TaxID=1965545 RepID=UPI000B4329F3|nr:Hsp33 family molecular chaperone HslO [Tyzzerella sp. An114]OUQ58889.1 Hsp33 family molecular chaperone [Tyzzerella sp. An114]HIT72903.1 Hsp33 family molecular chaperone HslO [Candidatus Fimicola cottocaccae]
MEDYIIRATAADGAIRAFAVTSKNTVETARSLHNTSPVATAALGRLLSAAAMMGIMLKGEKDLLTLQIRGDGPLQGIVVSADSEANVKGYVFNPYVEVPDKYEGKLDVSKAIGNGNISVIKDIGLKEPYCGQIELVSGEIAEDLTYYFAKSEQTPSAVGLGVLIDRDTTVMASGGFIIQLMPDADDEIAEKLEEKINRTPYVTTLLDMGYTPEDILKLILGDFNLEINEKKEMRFYCNCSRSRVEKALISLGKDELTKIIEEDKKAQLHCHFCNKEYNFNEDELREILKSAL